MREEQRRFRAALVTQGAMIAAIYAVLTLAFAPVSYGPVQVCFSEALSVLPMFTPAAVPGLAVGCFLANLLGGILLRIPRRTFGNGSSKA
jgi:uncharacterized membrane protein